jgi:hypothetical protein
MFKYSMQALLVTAISFWSLSSAAASVGLGEQSLNTWIDKGDYKTAWATLEMRANPNAVINGQPLFVKAFEKALVRDENNHIAAVNNEAAKIAVAMAKFGGNMNDLERFIAPYYKPGLLSSVFGASKDDLSGINQRMFSDMGTAFAFKRMIEEMKEGAKHPKRLWLR